MVQELRQIIFSKEEVIPALSAHNRVTPNFLPVGNITRFEIVGWDSVNITVEVAPCAQEVSMVVPGSKLLQALIRFCLENNIMLPRQGLKTVVIVNDRISLCISLDIETYLMSNMDNLSPATYAYA